MDSTLAALLHYTDWERQQWNDWLLRQGPEVLRMSAGAHGDGRFANIGQLVRHIFSAEKRYIERLSGRPLTDTAALPDHDLEALFQFGRQGRSELKRFLETCPAGEWDLPIELSILNRSLRASPHKIVIHVLTHEIRHWAQIATLLRLSGLTGEFHDLLFSPVLEL